LVAAITRTLTGMDSVPPTAPKNTFAAPYLRKFCQPQFLFGFGLDCDVRE
jgi:hypothetical protein